jgi:hypothetical protein
MASAVLAVGSVIGVARVASAEAIADPATDTRIDPSIRSFLV